ncbi:glycyl-radical enzyme activating protein [Bacteroidota bacterium]
MNGIVFDIQRNSLNDGPGIRTTVFLKGCPLNCVWCHNEESISIQPMLRYFTEKCTHCMECVRVCKPGAHEQVGEKHVLNFDRCIQAWDCIEVCAYGALIRTGTQHSLESVMQIVLKDRAYYRNSGGGLTVSGGEPMIQDAFTEALLKAAKSENIHTCLDTTGHVSWIKLERVIPSTDLFLYDYKETDSNKHKEVTGVRNELILENLQKLNSSGAKILLRCPVIPGINDRREHFTAIAHLSNTYKNILEVHLLPYHAMGTGKAQQHGICSTRKEFPIPSEEEKETWKSDLESKGCKNLKIF